MMMIELNTCWHHLGGLQCRSFYRGSFWIPWWGWFFFWKKEKVRVYHFWRMKQYRLCWKIRWMQKDTTASDVTWYLASLSLTIVCAKALFYTKLSQPGSKLRRQWVTTNVWFSNVGDPEIFPFFLNFQNGADDGQCRQRRWSSSLHSQRMLCNVTAPKFVACSQNSE